mgnify:CR=1 FL=1
MSGARFEPASGLRGELRAPPDKSISHRAALLAAFAAGTTRISRYLDSADTRSTLGAVEALGARVDILAAEAGGLEVEVAGFGLRGAAEPAGAIDVGNAGTLIRLISGLLAGQEDRRVTLDGDESIRRRPMDRSADWRSTTVPSGPRTARTVASHHSHPPSPRSTRSSTVVTPGAASISARQPGRRATSSGCRMSSIRRPTRPSGSSASRRAADGDA